MKVKRCPFCGKQPRYWEWNYGAMVECFQEDHRIQCEAKTLEGIIDPDGTLFVSVPKGTDIKRVVILEDETMFCTTFYPEGEEG